MQLSDHLEYHPVYLPTAAAFAQCQAAISQWQASGAPIVVAPYDLTWMPATALVFVQELAALFQAYNQVLWQHFSYCRQCGGQCCVVAASDVRPFDLLAMALLGETAPHLPERIAATPQACIYLNGQRCTWPTGWRTIKCWSFYCLGSGPWSSTTPLSELYQAVTRALQQVVAERLPVPLRRYEARHNMSLGDQLDDPVAFAHVLHTALDALLVAPLQRHYPRFARPVGSGPEPASALPLTVMRPNIALHGVDDLGTADGLEIIAAISEEILQSDGEGGEELLADLETLLWISESRPAQAGAFVQEIYERHAQPPASAQLRAAWQQLHSYLQRLLGK
jgi:hypothetical protein